MTEKLTYETWDKLISNNMNLKVKDYLDVLKWSFKEYADDILYACSFGAEGIVLVDLISKIKPNAKVIFLDTDLHFRETYDLITTVKDRYPALQIELVKPDLSVKEQGEKYGKDLWKTNPNFCCQIRKIEPLKEQLSTVNAWISGLRREQSPTRKNVEFINRDERFKKIKICPLIHWTWKDVWSYIQLNGLPYNILHDQNYPSIGCAKCTLPAADGDFRSGRWANREKTECGLHLV